MAPTIKVSNRSVHHMVRLAWSQQKTFYSTLRTKWILRTRWIFRGRVNRELRPPIRRVYSKRNKKDSAWGYCIIVTEIVNNYHHSAND